MWFMSNKMNSSKIFNKFNKLYSSTNVIKIRMINEVNFLN